MLNSRFASQGLSESVLRTPAEVTGRLLAVQAQDLRAAKLAIRPRLASSAEVTAADVDAGLAEGSLVVGWLNRGTLHLVRAEDYWWLHSVTKKRQVNPNQVRLREEGVSVADADRGLELIRNRLADGPATRGELRGLAAAAGIPVAGQALYHLLVLASIEGMVLRGPMIGGEQAFVLTAEWLDESNHVDPEKALAELARRFLAGHGPATDRDLAKWAGITLGQARVGLKAIGGELEELDGQVDLAGRTGSKRSAPVRLLGSFDPVLHGWASREWIIPAGEDRSVVTTNGIFRPTILVGDRIVGTWKMPGGKVELAPFDRLDRPARAALDAEAEAVVNYLASSQPDPGKPRSR